MQEDVERHPRIPTDLDSIQTGLAGFEAKGKDLSHSHQPMSGATCESDTAHLAKTDKTIYIGRIDYNFTCSPALDLNPRKQHTCRGLVPRFAPFRA